MRCFHKSFELKFEILRRGCDLVKPYRYSEGRVAIREFWVAERASPLPIASAGEGGIPLKET